MMNIKNRLFIYFLKLKYKIIQLIRVLRTMKNIWLILLVMYMSFAFAREVVEIYEVEDKQLLKIQFINKRDGIFILF